MQWTLMLYSGEQRSVYLKGKFFWCCFQPLSRGYNFLCGFLFQKPTTASPTCKDHCLPKNRSRTNKRTAIKKDLFVFWTFKRTSLDLTDFIGTLDDEGEAVSSTCLLFILFNSKLSSFVWIEHELNMFHVLLWLLFVTLRKRINYKIDSEINTVEIMCFCFAGSSCFHPIISSYGCLKIRNFSSCVQLHVLISAKVTCS